jgi:hypothetical protein
MVFERQADTTKYKMLAYIVGGQTENKCESVMMPLLMMMSCFNKQGRRGHNTSIKGVGSRMTAQEPHPAKNKPLSEKQLS